MYSTVCTATSAAVTTAPCVDRPNGDHHRHRPAPLRRKPAPAPCPWPSLNEITNRCRPVQGSVPPVHFGAEVAVCSIASDAGRLRSHVTRHASTWPAFDVRYSTISPSSWPRTRSASSSSNCSCSRRALWCSFDCPAKSTAWRSTVPRVDALRGRAAHRLHSSRRSRSDSHRRSAARLTSSPWAASMSCNFPLPHEIAACRAPARASAAAPASRRCSAASSATISATSPNRTTGLRCISICGRSFTSVAQRRLPTRSTATAIARAQHNVRNVESSSLRLCAFA